MKPGDFVAHSNSLRSKKVEFGIILTEETRKYSVETKFFNVLINGAPRICVEHQLELISVCELELI